MIDVLLNNMVVQAGVGMGSVNVIKKFIHIMSEHK